MRENIEFLLSNMDIRAKVIRSWRQNPTSRTFAPSKLNTLHSNKDFFQIGDWLFITLFLTSVIDGKICWLSCTIIQENV